MEIVIRRAQAEDALYLTSISFGAKRHWNYTEEYLALWHEQLTVTEEYINSSVVFVAQKGNTIIGYCSIVEATKENMEELGFEREGYWLNHIYIRPAYIQNGIGTKLIEQVQAYCKEQGIHLLQIESDMNANGFFEQLGAKYIKDIPLDEQGHVVCLYEYEIAMDSLEEADIEEDKIAINDSIEGVLDEGAGLIEKTDIPEVLAEEKEQVNQIQEKEETVEEEHKLGCEDLLLKSYQPVDLVSQEEIIALIQGLNVPEEEEELESIQEEVESIHKEELEDIIHTEQVEEAVVEEEIVTIEEVEDEEIVAGEETKELVAREETEEEITTGGVEEIEGISYTEELEDYFNKPLSFNVFQEDAEARRMRLEREVLEQKFQELDQEDDEVEETEETEEIEQGIAETVTEYTAQAVDYSNLIADNELREDLQSIIDRRVTEEKENRRIISQLESEAELAAEHPHTEKEKMLAGEFYIDWGDELAEDKCRAKRLLKELNSIDIEDKKQFSMLVHTLFGSVGECVHIEPDFKCKFGSNIYIGDNFYADYNCVILDNGKVTIGDNCILSPQVGIYTLAYPTEVDKRIAGYEYACPVTIGNNVWIGGGSRINPGVTIGNNVVVNPGSVICTDIPDNVMVAGNPAKIIQNL